MHSWFMKYRAQKKHISTGTAMLGIQFHVYFFLISIEKKNSPELCVKVALGQNVYN